MGAEARKGRLDIIPFPRRPRLALGGGFSGGGGGGDDECPPVQELSAPIRKLILDALRRSKGLTVDHFNK